ncbi:helix-turn-helix protein [Actinomadura pelletieri DSM 43383]|uniref:Helix-turn-helix protein n=1 Tax=Actinomadura pelletieri DSM 43383 TaxID=1120940 RepID=A0A495QSA3_9ACTN|nr:helix-turn-helix transcriptional regulator [Actinomadura pelletieri]RKS76382.1 helix-turn-helix protein [Actinomadura pelletieri DSM 43383]
MTSPAQQAKEAFGARLRDIRKDAGLSGRRLAEITGWHYTKVSRVEHGKQGLSDADIHAWCSACDAMDQITELVVQARAVETMYREWRKQARNGLRRLQEEIEPLYAKTSLFRVHEHWSIPGLLQTSAYSEVSMAYWARLLNLPDDREAATRARIERQRVLREGGRRFVFLLAEQTLRSRVGSIETMLEQLDRVIASMSLPNVSLGIIPASAGMGAHTQTSFWIFDNDLVKVETLTAALDITWVEEIEVYITVFNEMRESALFGQAARDLVLSVRDELLQHSATF